MVEAHPPCRFPRRLAWLAWQVYSNTTLPCGLAVAEMTFKSVVQIDSPQTWMIISHVNTMRDREVQAQLVSRAFLELLLNLSSSLWTGRLRTVAYIPQLR
jgi:hypothetical protein